MFISNLIPLWCWPKKIIEEGTRIRSFYSRGEKRRSISLWKYLLHIFSFEECHGNKNKKKERKKKNVSLWGLSPSLLQNLQTRENSRTVKALVMECNKPSSAAALSPVIETFAQDWALTNEENLLDFWGAYKGGRQKKWVPDFRQTVLFIDAHGKGQNSKRWLETIATISFVSSLPSFSFLAAKEAGMCSLLTRNC